MKLKFEVIADFSDSVLGKDRKAGEKFEADHLDKRVWELVKAGVAKQVEE